MDETFDSMPILPPPPQFAKRRSGLFVDKTFGPDQVQVQPSGVESLAIREYMQKLESERKEFTIVWTKEKRLEKAEPPVLDSSLLATDQLAFVKGGPNLKEFIDTVMETTKEVADFVKRKNRVLKRQDFVVDKLNYMLANTVADIITETEFSS